MSSALSLPGFSSPAAGPDAPIAMIEACHARVERQCRTIERLAAHLPSHGSDEAAREAAQAVLRYFDTAAVHHHADEEQDLFPALLESMAGSDAVCIRELTGSLMAEHRELEGHWRALRPSLQAVADGQAAPLPAAATLAFLQAYRSHIGREDSELLPMARRLLGEADLARVGNAMARRRGLA